MQSLRKSRMRFAVMAVSLVLLLVHARSAAADAQSLNVLLVIDTNAGVVGGDVKEHRFWAMKDLERIQGVVDEVHASAGASLKNRLFLTVLKGKDVTPAKIRKYYASLPFDPACNHLLYYSGHGAVDAGKGPFYGTSGGRILVSEIYNLMSNTGAKGIFLLSDCCSVPAVFAGSEGQGGSRGSWPVLSPSSLNPSFGRSELEVALMQPRAADGKKANVKMFYDLFYRAQGVVKICASAEGQFSFSGHFSSALSQSLCMPSASIRPDARNGTVTWPDFFPKLQSLTNQSFQEAKKIAPAGTEQKKAKSQFPRALKLGGWPNQYRRHLVVHNKTGHKLNVWLECYDLNFKTGQWQWFRPTQGTSCYVLNAGEKTALNAGDREAAGSRIRIWAATQDGLQTWDRYREEDLCLSGKDGYQGPIGKYTHTIQP
jgi:Caspase domain